MELLKIQLKNMGFLFYIPIFICIFYMIILLILPNELKGTLFIVLQLFVIPFACWWPIYNLYDLYQGNSEEIIVVFMGKHLLLDYFKFTGLFFMLVFFLFLATNIKTTYSLPPSFLFFIFSQAILLSTFSLFLTIFFKNVETACLILILYVFSEALTMGKVFLWPHIFLFTFENHSSVVLSLTACIYLFFSAIFLFGSFKYVQSIERQIF